MYKHKILNFIFIILLLSCAGCADDKKSIYETGHKVVSLVMPNEQPTMEVVVDPSSKSTVSLKAQIDQISAFGIVVEVEARNDLIEAYNKKNGTSYQELSASSYVFEKTEFVFPKYSEVASSVPVSLNTSAMQTDVFYLLPIQMISIKGDENASINEDKDIMYLIISKLPPPALIHLKDVELTTEIGANKKNWFAAFATNSEGGHTFTIKEAASQSHMMDFVLVKFGSNLRIHPSIIGWQHGGDYHKFTGLYTEGFEKLTHTSNANKLYKIDDFNAVGSSEEMTAKIEELRVSSAYNFYTMNRMTSHNIQSQLTETDRVFILGWGAKISVNTKFAMIYIKEVTPINGGADYSIKFDIKYIDSDIRTEALNTDGQNVIIDNPGYHISNKMAEYKGIELTTEIGDGKKNWFSAYADKDIKTFTQQDARNKSSMLDFAAVLGGANDVRLYAAGIGVKDVNYKVRIAPYISGFSRLTYSLIGGERSTSADATKPEHYDSVIDVESMTQLINFYRVGYAYPVADRVASDKLRIGAVYVLGWGNKEREKNTSYVNNKFGIMIVRDLQPTTGGNYKVVLDIKVPESDSRSMNNGTIVNNPDL